MRSEVDFLYPKGACFFLHFLGGIEWIDVYEYIYIVRAYGGNPVLETTRKRGLEG